MEIVTKSAQETAALGEKIANQLIINHQPLIIALTGELGSGKTIFVQGLAKGLGIKERILSPTFVMIREYQVHSAKCIAHKFFHVDLYRVENEKDIESLGLAEIWSDPKNLVAIEWAEKIKKILPGKRIDIHLGYLKEDKRRINISYINI